MFETKLRYLVTFVLFILAVSSGFSQNTEGKEENETLEQGIEILKKYFYDGNNWHIVQPSVGKDVDGLIHFIEDVPIDTIIQNMDSTFNGNQYFVTRLPENVPDSLNIPGYYPVRSVEKDIENLGVNLQRVYRKKKIGVPTAMMSNLEERLNLIPEGKGMELFVDSVYIMPDSLQIPEVIPDSLLNSPEKFEQLRITDSLRNIYVENTRRMYNDLKVTAYVDSIVSAIKQQQFEREFTIRTKNLTDSVKVNNYEVLKEYNELVVHAVNDSIFIILKALTDYANFIDSTQVSILNLKGEVSAVPLKEGDERFARVWLKNEQNDSLRILVKTTGKRSMQMLIDDGVTFTRFKQKETKSFDFKSLERNIASLTKVGKSYEVETPWRIGGNGAVGLTQTYLENWKKGGESALSLLIMLNGFANYSRADGKVKWENTGVIRNGWIRPGGKGSEIQKNDDRLEFTTRYGVSAFKKWYYSTEFNFETQFFKGFRYPTESHPEPISAFIAPAKLYFKLGLEYKPDKNFSLLLSPLTIKNVYVRDTILIDQTKFGIDPNKKSFWEPGLNADLKFKKNITDDISYQTKYKMFVNYKAPFKKFDLNWENLFVIKLNDYFNIRLLVHFIYDDDILFPVYDENDNKIGEKPKLQIKELMTIGFSYKINKKVMRTKRIR